MENKSRENIANAILAQGKSLRALQEMSGIAYSRIHAMTNTNKNFTVDNLIKVLDSLGLEIQVVEKK